MCNNGLMLPGRTLLMLWILFGLCLVGAAPQAKAQSGSRLYLPMVARAGNTATIRHGQDLTRTQVGPEAIGVTSYARVYAGSGIYDGRAYPFVEWVDGAAEYDGYRVDEPHLLIDGQHIQGGLDFYTTRPVVIRGSRIRPTEGGYWGVHFRGQQALVLYSSIGAISSAGAPDDPTHKVEAAIRGEVASAIFVRNALALACNMIEIGGDDIQIIENLMTDFVYYTDAHLDGIQFGGGVERVQILRNRIVLNHGDTGAISLFQDWGVNRDIRIESNYLAGGGYTFYGGDGSKGQPTQIVFRDNIFGRDIWPKSGYWGPVTSWVRGAPGNVWADNRYADGTVVPEP